MTELPDELQSIHELVDQLSLARRIIARLQEELELARLWRVPLGKPVGTSEVDAARKELAELKRMRPIAELHEDHGPVLIWRVPIEEPPFVGSSLDDDFQENVDYYESTHWSPLPQPVEPDEPDEGDASSGCPPHWLRVDVHPNTAAEPDRCVDCGHACGSPDCKMRHGDR